MRLYVCTRCIDLTESVNRQAYSKLSSALDRMEDEVESVRVQLIDTNGPCFGGVDKVRRVCVFFCMT